MKIKNENQSQKQKTEGNVTPQVCKDHREEATRFLHGVCIGMSLYQVHILHYRSLKRKSVPHQAVMKAHKITVLAYVFGCSHVYNPLSKKIGS